MPDNKVVSEPFSTAGAFLDALRPEHWTAPDSWQSAWVFRGHRDASWELVASALRPGVESVQYFADELHDKLVARAPKDRFGGIRGGLFMGQQVDENLAEKVCRQTYAEFHLVRAFVESANELGFPMPDAEKFLTPQAADWIPTGPGRVTWPLGPEWMQKWPAVALAQHHGVPTSYLDWTRSPLIAAHFAAHKITPGDHPDLAVWALCPDRLVAYAGSGVGPTYFEPFRAPRGTNPFLHAQDGLFICMPRASEYFMQHGAWPDLEAVCQRANEWSRWNQVLRMLTLPASQAGELLRLLSLRGISRAQLMPTLDSAAVSLEARWRWQARKVPGTDDRPA